MTIANIQTKANFLANTTRGASGSLTDANFLIILNQYYEQIVARIISETVGGKTQFGDFNYTAFPIFTFNLTNGTQSYDLNDISTTPLTIMGIEVVDNGGISHPLDRITLKDIQRIGIAQSEYQKTNGLPREFEIRDNQIVLYPAPATVNVTLTNGLRVFYLRTADVFTEAQRSTGTKQPGFPAPWHDMLADAVAYEYTKANSLSNPDRFLRDYNSKMEAMLDFISRRDQDVDYAITGQTANFR